MINKDELLKIQYDKDYQLKTIKENVYAIQYIHNPSEEICLQSVKQDGFAIQYIDNPSYKVCLEAVKQSGFTIKYINNPTDEVCFNAVKQYGNAICYIPFEKRTLEMCELALDIDPTNIRFCDIEKYPELYDKYVLMVS